MKRYPGKHGIYIKKYKNHQAKYIYNDGYLMIRYSQQPFSIKFKNRMVNDINQHYCGGWFMSDIDYSFNTLYNRVKGGVKPCMFDIASADKISEIEKRAEADGLFIYIERRSFAINDKVFNVYICQNKTFGELFDLATLQNDYANNGLNINTKPYTHVYLSEFCRNWDWQVIGGAEVWVTGLLLGYPIENTISLCKGAIK